jgi:membrane-anchored protein YejM (alkaline phosphatase superfamily)
MNRPGWTVDRDVRTFKGDEPGSAYFAIFKKAGYETSIVSAANINWLGFLDRIQGKEKLVDRLFCPYIENPEKPRNHLDTMALGGAMEWIDDMYGEKPFFMVLEFDSTHWTYFPDEDLCLDEPSVDSINMLKLRSEDEIKPVYNRYKNAVRTVEDRIGKLLDHLKKNDRIKDTVVVIVSDHGEGFAPGRIGHSVLHDDIEKVYLSMWLPGENAGVIDKTVQQRDVFPTLFAWLGLPSMDDIMLGSNVLKHDYSEYPLLVFHGSIEMADLIYRDHVIRFGSRVKDDSVMLTPFGITDREGNNMDAKMIEIFAPQWKDDVTSLIRRE